MPFDVKTFERLLAPSFRPALHSRFVKLGWVPESNGSKDKGIASSVGDEVLATQHVFSRPKLDILARDYVVGLPESAIRPICVGTEATP